MKDKDNKKEKKMSNCKEKGKVFIIGEVETTETRSKRLNLLLTPYRDDALGKCADVLRISKNELINQICEDFIQNNMHLINKWYEFFDGKNL